MAYGFSIHSGKNIYSQIVQLHLLAFGRLDLEERYIFRIYLLLKLLHQLIEYVLKFNVTFEFFLKKEIFKVCLNLLFLICYLWPETTIYTDGLLKFSNAYKVGIY